MNKINFSQLANGATYYKMNKKIDLSPSFILSRRSKCVTSKRSLLQVPCSRFHVLIIALFSLLTPQLYSQGNLQFNQVLNIEFTSTSTTSFTVPAGKVWKLENCMLSSINNYACMVYNGTTYFLRQHNTSSSAWDNFPFWFGSGKTMTFGGGCSPGIVSIIEFNVVP